MHINKLIRPSVGTDLTEFLLLLVLPMTNGLAQMLSLSDSCSFLHNATPLDNTVILFYKRVFVKSN